MMDSTKLKIVIAYYIGVLLLVAFTAYLVFWRGESGFWFVGTLILIETIAPHIKSENENSQNDDDDSQITFKMK